ncbi:MAG: MarR family transcriptional regulator [Nibricoccus sp.]
MAQMILKNLPRYECLHEAAQQFPDLDPSAMVAYLHLLRAGTDCQEFSHEYLSSHGVSSGRFTVLMLLLKRQACGEKGEIVTPAELAEMAGCTRATMTGLIDTLERDSLVKRLPDATDRRMMTVSLTTKGTALLNKLLPGHFKRQAELMACLSEAERKTLVRLLEKISEQLSSIRGGEPSSPGCVKHG